MREYVCVCVCVCTCVLMQACVCMSQERHRETRHKTEHHRVGRKKNKESFYRQALCIVTKQILYILWMH